MFLGGILNFIALFLGLCFFAVFSIALYNIYTKSYNPRNSIIIIATLSVLFLATGFLALQSLGTVSRNLSNSVSIPQNRPGNLNTLQ